MSSLSQLLLNQRELGSKESVYPSPSWMLVESRIGIKHIDSSVHARSAVDLRWNPCFIVRFQRRNDRKRAENSMKPANHPAKPYDADRFFIIGAVFYVVVPVSSPAVSVSKTVSVLFKKRTGRVECRRSTPLHA